LTTMPTSTKPAGFFASNFNPGSSGKNINKGNKPTLDGKRDTSPWQHKTVTIRKILQHIVDEAGNRVFHAVNRVMLGPEAGSL
jgi:hypothetical protein